MKVLFFTVFLDLVGFGLLIPLMPFLAEHFQASPFDIGLLMAVYSGAQLISAPLWGGLSDRFGRRPVILISIAGSAASAALFAFSSSLAALFFARAFAGVFGGNISAAHAAMADLTGREERSKAMGLLGAAFGLGFILGPLIGAGAAHIGGQLGSAPPFGMSFASLVAAVLSVANLIFAVIWLPETRWGLGHARGETTTAAGDALQVAEGHIGRYWQVVHHLRDGKLGPLAWIFALGTLAMALMEVMMFKLMSDRFGWQMITASLGFAYIGICLVLTQGLLVRRLMPLWGEWQTLKIGLIAFALGLATVGLSWRLELTAIGVTLLAIGNGLMRPPNLGLLSLAANKDQQGAVMGTTQALGALARVVGPAAGGVLYASLSPAAPFLIAAGLAVLALAILWTHVKPSAEV
jgi:MFS family permease